jgi:hypothetical protein
MSDYIMHGRGYVHCAEIITETLTQCRGFCGNLWLRYYRGNYKNMWISGLCKYDRHNSIKLLDKIVTLLTREVTGLIVEYTSL